MNNYRKLIKNSSIFAIASFGTKMMSIILVPFYTFVLTTEEYGNIDLITTTISLLMPIITLSIFDSVFRFAMDKTQRKDEILTSALGVVIIGSIVSIIVIPIIRLSSLRDYAFLFYVILILQSIHTLLSNFIRAIGKVKLFALDGVINTLILLVFNIILLSLFNYGINGYLISILISHMLSCIFIILFGDIFKFIRINKYNKVLIKDMLVYGLPLIPNALMWWVMNISDRYIITLFLGAGSNGLYAVANKIPSLLNIINNIFFQAWQLSAIEEADSELKSEFFTNVFNTFLTIMFIVTSIILVFIKPIINIIVSVQYKSAWRYVPFLLLGIVFSSFAGFLGTNYIAMKKTDGVLKTSIIGAIINLILNFVLIPSIGINGAAISTMFSFFVVWILRIIDTKEYVDIRINIKKISITLLLISIQIIILFMEFKIEMILQLIIATIIILFNSSKRITSFSSTTPEAQKISRYKRFTK